MKKLALITTLLAGATAGYTQGIINWTDYVGPSGGLPGFSITVFSPGPGGFEQRLGNTSQDLPAGNATYFGTPLGQSGTGSGPFGYGNGANYSIGLYVDTTAAGVQHDVTYGTPVATDTFAAGFGGWDFNGELLATVHGLPSGTPVWVELAAWYSGSGATSYAAAVADGLPEGISFTSSGTTVLGGGGVPPVEAGTLEGIGITDFSLNGTPEPGTIVLGVMGTSAFLMRQFSKK
jgi:hypothetical protein